MEEDRSAFKMLTGKPTGKRPLRRLRRRWEDNIKMDLEVIGMNKRNWVNSAQDMDYWRAFVNAALYLRVPLAMELVSHLLSMMEHCLQGIARFPVDSFQCGLQSGKFYNTMLC